MLRITIYLDDKVAARLKAQVRAAGGSRSQRIRDAARMRLNQEWPASVRALAGAWPDFHAPTEKKADRGRHERARLERSSGTLRLRVGKRTWERADLCDRS